jgi:ATP phosphoribosyltransferase
MTQFQFDIICKIVSTGAPALANELNSALDEFVQSYNACLEENAQLKAQIEKLATNTEKADK